MTFPYSSTVCHTDTNIKGGVKQNEYVFEILSWIDDPSWKGKTLVGGLKK